MRISTALKARLDPNDLRFVTGSPEERERARRDWHRDRALAEVMGSALEEVPRSRLAFHRRGLIEDTENRQLFRAHRGQLDLDFVPDAAAYYIAADGWPVVLVRPAGAQTFAEREQQRAAREAARNAELEQQRARRAARRQRAT